jgi:hypothetical protein
MRSPIRLPPDLAEHVRARLRMALQPAFIGTQASEGGRRLSGRLRHLARQGVRARDATLVSSLQAALRFAAGGHTAGEAALVEQLLALDDAALLLRIRALPTPTALPTLLVPRLVGIILFEASCPAHGPTATLPDALIRTVLFDRRNADDPSASSSIPIAALSVHETLSRMGARGIGLTLRTQFAELIEDASMMEVDRHLPRLPAPVTTAGVVCPGWWTSFGGKSRCQRGCLTQSRHGARASPRRVGG